MEVVLRIQALLDARCTLSFVRLPSGLYPAANLEGTDTSSGYQYVWARDNVYVGWAHWVSGDTESATGVARALLAFYLKYSARFEAIIAGDANPGDPGQRPHVRFDGSTLTEISSQRWAHAQNDALGYVLWFAAKLLRNGALPGSSREWETLSLFPRYFEAIRYWEDEDSGHWEEVRKVSASSIGVVVAALEAWAEVLRGKFVARPAVANRGCDIDAVLELAAKGRGALEKILPNECIQSDPAKNRTVDAALLFLLYPLQVVTGNLGSQIVSNCEQHLKGDFGFRRYVGDSYWAPDYDLKLTAGERTRDFSEDMAFRDAMLPAIGQEAQWCIFDSMLSAFYGSRYALGRDPEDLEQQTAYLNRALEQITAADDPGPPWRCPELYYLRRGAYAPNPHLPLQWAQANLMVALHAMIESTKLAKR